MYYLKIFATGLTLLSLLGQSKISDTTAGDTSLTHHDQTGVYLSPDDYTHNKLSYGGDCSNGSCKVKVHALFGSVGVDLVCDGKKQSFLKDELYGYRDCKNNDYRFSGGSTYQILDTAGFYLYSVSKLVQGAKIARPQTVYYFSVLANSPLQELTLANLQNAFAANTKFRYSLEGQFRSDKGLMAYDNTLKTYKIKYLYSESVK